MVARMNTNDDHNGLHKPGRQQLELSFDGSEAFRPRMTQRTRRQSRAQWWFAQMRAVVDRAFDWNTAPAPRPEQVHLALSTSR
jgi:hypothetical protein